MRKDVTLGLAVATVLFGAVGAYVVFFTKPKTPVTANNSNPPAKAEVTPKKTAQSPTLFGGSAGSDRITDTPADSTSSRTSDSTAAVPGPTTLPTRSESTADRPRGNWEHLLYEDNASAPSRNHPDSAGASRVAAPTPATSSGSSTTYVVKPGDTLWNIAATVYGNGVYNNRIAAANPGINPNNLKAGTKLNIPDKTSVVTETGHTVPATSTVNPTTQYRVVSGDNLNTISRNLYGTTRMAADLFEANKDLLANPNSLKPGMVLKLPSPPTSSNTTPASAGASSTSIISSIER